MEREYFYGQQSDLFSFYRIPKVLFTDKSFSKLSAEAKTLYGILLDRMNLSAKNGWQDEEGRVYIIFPIEEIMESMGCGNKKAGQMLNELEEKAGLIIRKRRGLGRPNLIYVMNFVSGEGPEEGHFQKCQNDTSGSVEMTSLEMSKRHGSNTDSNNTEMSNTYLFYPQDVSSRTDTGNVTDEMEERRSYEEYFMDSLDFPVLLHDNPGEEETLKGIVSLLVETCCSKQPFLYISGDMKPTEVVKNRFMKLHAGHIRYVLDSLKENTTRIRNVRQYLMATLYNAQDTMSTYYQSRVNNDMASGRF